MGNALTDRQRKYCHAIVQGQSAASAARTAGYSKASSNNQGSRLGKNADIQAEIARLKAKALQKSEAGAILSALEVRQRLTSIAEDDANKPQDRIRALELLGKTLGLFVDKPALEVNVTLQALQDATYEDLKELEARLVGSST